MIFSRLDALCLPSSLRVSIKTEGSKSLNRENPSTFFPMGHVPIHGVSMEASGLKCPHYYAWVCI